MDEKKITGFDLLSRGKNIISLAKSTLKDKINDKDLNDDYEAYSMALGDAEIRELEVNLMMNCCSRMDISEDFLINYTLQKITDFLRDLEDEYEHYKVSGIDKLCIYIAALAQEKISNVIKAMDKDKK